MKSFALLLVAVLAGCATASPAPTEPEAVAVHPHWTEEARADEKPEVIAYQVPLELTHAVAGDTIASITPSFTFACPASGATKIKPPTSGAGSARSSAGYLAIWVWVNSATPVYFGDSTLDTTGMPLCTAGASCPRADQVYSTRELDCLSSNGTVNVVVQVAQQ